MSRPADEALADRIEKLAARVGSNPQFESIVLEKQGDNPDFAFLNGGEGADYYQAQKQSAMSAMPADGGLAPPPMLAPPPPMAPAPPAGPPPDAHGGGYGGGGYGGGGYGGGGYGGR